MDTKDQETTEVEPVTSTTDEASHPHSGENDSSKAITGAVEAGYGGSVAGTNDAFEDEDGAEK